MQINIEEQNGKVWREACTIAVTGLWLCGRFQPQQPPAVTTILSTTTLYIFSFVQTSVSKVLFAELRMLFVGKGLLQFNLFIDNTVNVILKTRRKAI